MYIFYTKFTHMFYLLTYIYVALYWNISNIYNIKLSEVIVKWTIKNDKLLSDGKFWRQLCRMLSQTRATMVKYAASWGTILVPLMAHRAIKVTFIVLLVVFCWFQHLQRLCTFCSRALLMAYSLQKKCEIMQFSPQKNLVISKDFYSPTRQFSHIFPESRGPRSPFPNQCK